MTFITRRKIDNCEPMIELTVPQKQNSRTTIASLKQWLERVGPQLQRLGIEDELSLDAKENLHTIIAMLDRLCPSLQQLSFYYSTVSPDDAASSNQCTTNTEGDLLVQLAGKQRFLPKLREITIRSDFHSESTRKLTFARYLALLGRDDCVYQTGGYYVDAKENRILNDHIRNHKS